MKNVKQMPFELPPQLVVAIIFQSFRLPDHFPTQYLTAEEVAYLFSIHKRTVYRWGKCGRLRRYCFGRRTFYKREELFGYLDSLYD